MKNNTELTGLERQKAFLQEIQSGDKKDDSFFVTEKVMESMRDSGYRDIRRALNDLIDNSEQAGAKNIAVITTTEREKAKNAREKISNIAVIDDGHGMYPEMLEIAVKWGGTDRHNERDGLGRFGFGLPTASISITRTYEVYSRVLGGAWHKVRVDLNEITNSAMKTGGNVAFTPKNGQAELPDFVKDYIKKTWKQDDLKQGTVVVLLNPDRIRSFTLPQAFQTKMMQNVGLTYRHFLDKRTFYVNDKKVGMIDPLFLNPNCIGYDAGNGFKAEGLDEITIPIKNKWGNGEGIIKLRIAFMHPRFQKKGTEMIANRFNVMKENNGYFIVCRAGRQIDVARDTSYPKDSDNITMVNYDRNWAIELDFEPVLDELFGITTNKQQVEIDSYLWEIFKENSIPEIVSSMRKKGKKLRDEEEIKSEENKTDNRDSEAIMKDTEKFDDSEIPTEKKEEAQGKLLEAAAEEAKEENKPVEEVVAKLEGETEKRKYKVEFHDHPGAPFYDVELWGQQTKIKINTAHLFYTDIYSQQDARGKTAIELLLFVLGKCELESSGDKLLFYGNERFEWSRKLDLRLKVLDKSDPIIDKLSYAEEAN